MSIGTTDGATRAVGSETVTEGALAIGAGAGAGGRGGACHTTLGSTVGT
jgi:hypothetical protein